MSTYRLPGRADSQRGVANLPEHLCSVHCTCTAAGARLLRPLLWLGLGWCVGHDPGLDPFGVLSGGSLLNCLSVCSSPVPAASWIVPPQRTSSSSNCQPEHRPSLGKPGRVTGGAGHRSCQSARDRSERIILVGHGSCRVLCRRGTWWPRRAMSTGRQEGGTNFKGVLVRLVG